MEIQENKKYKIIDIQYDFGLDFKNLIDEIEKGDGQYNLLLLPTLESDLPGGNKMYHFEKLNKTCENYNINVCIVFGAPDCEYYDDLKKYKNILIEFWPTSHLSYYYKKYDSFFYGKKIKDLKKNLKFKNTFLCYNLEPHSHRCELIDKLYESGLFDYGEISWNKLNDTNHKFKFWEEKILKLDNFDSDPFQRSYHIIDNPSFLYLASESRGDIPFITEKTFKPILIEQPFISLSGKLHHNKLKNFGFELYDEIFDYGFDNKESLEERINGIVDNIKNIKNENYIQLYEKIKDKIRHNKETAISIVENNLYIPKIVTENNLNF